MRGIHPATTIRWNEIDKIGPKHTEEKQDGKKRGETACNRKWYMSVNEDGVNQTRAAKKKNVL